MYIKKHGNFVHEVKETRSAEFCCSHCYCKFVAEPGEYLIGKKNRQFFAMSEPNPRITVGTSVCPECGELLMVPERAIKFKETDRIDNLQKLFLEANNYVIVESENRDINSGIYQVKVTVLERSYDKNGINFKFNLALYSKDDCRLITLGQNFNFDSLAIYKYDEKKE